MASNEVGGEGGRENFFARLWVGYQAGQGMHFFCQANTNHPVLHLVNYDIGLGNDTQGFARNTVQVHIVKG